MIGKLHSIFSEAGRGGDDSTIPGYGNPATSRVAKDYLAAMRVEQLEARIVPTQADPFFISDAAAIAAFIGKRVNESDLSATQLFVPIRDRAFLSVYRFRGVIFFVQLACREKWPLHLWILLLSRAAFNLYSTVA